MIPSSMSGVACYPKILGTPRALEKFKSVPLMYFFVKPLYNSDLVLTTQTVKLDPRMTFISPYIYYKFNGCFSFRY